MKKLLLLTSLLSSSIFCSDVSRATWELANQVVLSRGTAEAFFQLEKAAFSAGSIAPMDFTKLSQGTQEAFNKLAQVTTSIASENPKLTIAMLGTGALSCFAYKGINYISNMDPKTAGSTALMGYGALHMLLDTKKALSSMLFVVEKAERDIRAEIIMDEFHEMQSASEEIESNMNKDNMTAHQRSAILLQLGQNNLQSVSIFQNFANN